MKKELRHERLGFDPEALLSGLLEKLIAVGGVASDDPRVRFWNAERAPETDEALRFRYLLFLGMDHQNQHGIQQGGPLCKSFPCPVAGLSAAIVQIAGDQVERRDPMGFVALSDVIADFKKQPATLSAYLRWFLEINKDSTAWLVPLSDSSRLALARLDALMEVLGPLQSDLLSQLESPQFQQSGVGRRAERVLTAVYQHLHLTGGFTFAELAAIKLDCSEPGAAVPDSYGAQQALKSAAEAIEKRVRSDDERTWHPYRRNASAETTPPGHSVT